MYVTFEELILFATLICGIISLVVVLVLVGLSEIILKGLKQSKPDG